MSALLVCPECGNRMILRESHLGLFYGCSAFPWCRAVHGAHDDGTPLGIPADKATRKWRAKAHEAFDVLWQKHRRSRSEAYAWMAEILEVPPEKAHIGMLNQSQCQKLIEAAEKQAILDRRENRRGMRVRHRSRAGKNPKGSNRKKYDYA